MPAVDNAFISERVRDRDSSYDTIFTCQLILDTCNYPFWFGNACHRIGLLCTRVSLYFEEIIMVVKLCGFGVLVHSLNFIIIIIIIIIMILS